MAAQVPHHPSASGDKAVAFCRDEAVPARPELGRGYPLVVFGDHRFCAGHSLLVQPMTGPHMHSQIELNFVLHGQMTYAFEERVITLSAGRLAMFWGMIPHQVIACDPDTTFVVLYVPMAAFLELPSLGELRAAIFAGAVVEGLVVRPCDAGNFQRWREELQKGDQQFDSIVKDELGTRIRRLALEGWRDLREISLAQSKTGSLVQCHTRALKVEKMARFIGEHAMEDISVEDVARIADLHPNYAMTLYKRAVGLTIKQSITRHRLDTAQSMLIASEASVAAIAFDCGFGSLSSFYAAFSERFSLSPAAFRQAYRHIATPS